LTLLVIPALYKWFVPKDLRTEPVSDLERTEPQAAE
jgi:hypothetical protein